jgi:hypothetical protein
MGARTSIPLLGVVLAAALSACGTTGAVGAPVTQATADLPWQDQVLAIARPFADRRLSTTAAPESPLLALGFDALGRASGDARYATAANVAGRSGEPPTRASWDAFCTGTDCNADDLLYARSLWAGPGGDEMVGAGIVALDPPFRRMAGTLFDRQALLFHADTAARMDGRFDARLNATAFAALTRMIDALPAETPARLEYVAWYREMARPIVRLQGPDGWWRTVLDDETAPIDRSASALYVYGLTWGLNSGLLSFNEGEAAALRGWDALRSTEGATALQTDDEGLGALLLASAQMAERRW